MRWGGKDKSKSLTIRDYDVDVNEPVNTYLALRSWMVMRSQRNDWCFLCPARHAWWLEECDKLRRNVRDADLSPKALALFQQWTPELL